MKKILLGLLPVFACLTALAQNNIKGIVKDDAGSVIAAATVSLLNAADSSWISSELTNEKGQFVFADVPVQNYVIDIAAPGYRNVKTQFLKDKLNEEQQYTLHKTSQALEEVVVSAKKPFIQTELGKTILNIDENATASGNLLDLLKRAPGVNVDMNEILSMVGKQGVLVYIDDKPVYLSGKDLAAYLKGVSENEVAQVELITQPSARYDAAGNEGIINIKTKKNRNDGMNGTLALQAGQGVYPSTHNSLQLNYRKNKLSLFASAGYLYATGYLRQTTDRNIKNENGQTSVKMNQSSFMKETFEDYNLKLAADYRVSDKVTTGIMVTGIYHPNNETDLSNGIISDYTNSTTTNFQTVSTNRFLRKHFYTNAYLRHNIKEGEELYVNADYFHYEKKLYQLQENYLYDGLNQPLPGGLLLRSTQPYVLDVASAKADYSKTLSGKTKLEAGLKTSFTGMDADMEYDIHQNNNWNYDPTRSNHFVYGENINAAYVSLNHELNEQIKIQGGLRAENFNMTGDQLTTGESFGRSSIALFPTLFTGYKVDDKNQLELNYSRRVQRPEYRQLNPFSYYISQYSYTVGNPRLLPQYLHRFELKHSFRNKLISTLYCNLKKDVMNELQFNDPNTHSTYTTMANLGQSTNAGFYATYNLEFYKYLKASIYGLAYIADYSGVVGNEEVSTQGTGYAFSLDSQVLIGDKWYAEYNMYCAGRSNQSVMSTSLPFISQSFGVSYSFWSDTGTLKLTASDPFDIYRFKDHSVLGNVESYSSGKYQSQYYALEFRYNFGKKNNGQQRNNQLSEEAHRAGM